MNEICSCCKGIHKLTPGLTINPPGRDKLNYRVGTHASFLETMKARLSNLELTAADFDGADGLTKELLRPLLALTTRTASDPAIALLDGWALVADVLTFYQERIANEGFLRTALERRSILELARLIGYRLGPGVAASVYLAYTLEKGTAVVIPEGARAQSVPGPGELPQSFETADKLPARAEWNTLQARLTQPQVLGGLEKPLYFKGTATKLKPNDPLLISCADQKVVRVLTVEPDQAAGRTKVTFQLWNPATRSLTGSSASVREADSAAVTETAAAMRPADARRVGFAPGPSTFERASGLTGDLEKPAAQPPANSLQLGGSVAGNFSPGSDALSRLLLSMRPSLGDSFYNAWENLPVTSSQPCCVYALRTRASVFGHNAPLKPIADVKTGRVVGTNEWTLFRDAGGSTERFVIGIKLNRNQDARSFSSLGIQTIDVNILIYDVERTTANTTLLGSGSALNVPFTSSPFNVPVNNTPDREVVIVTVSERTSTTAEVIVDLQFSRRNLSVKVGRWQQPITETFVLTIWAATSTGSDPTTVTYNNIDPNSVGVLGDFETGSQPTEEPNKISLDASYKGILPDSWVVLEKPRGLVITRVARVREASRADYGLAAEGTQLELERQWISTGTAPRVPGSDGFEVIRGTKVFAESELLELADEPVTEPVCGDRIELANLVRGLEPGRWLLVTGERADITPTPPGPDPTVASNAYGMRSELDDLLEEKQLSLPGVMATELVMLAGVEQGYDPNLPGDKTHTTLLLSPALSYCYKRETLIIYGNVVKATHGETKNEVLGNGDGSRPMQQFDLRQSPLTYLASTTPAGAASTLQVRVNNLLWHERSSLVDLGPKDHGYITRTDDNDQTTVVFGNGQYGARLPTGDENIKAVYRIGIGKPGNVKAQQISSPVTRPLGVKSVTNPLPATGGADREDGNQARRNAPMAVMALDRLISTQDHEDFVRTYAGIAKASAARLSDGRREIVHLTIAGSDDIPIAPTSDLFVNLRQSLHQFGDPYQSIQVAVRKLKHLIISAKVRLLPDYQWEFVEPKIRAALLDKFSFAQRELGQDALPSEALSVIQAQAGVAYVDLDIFDAVDEDESAGGFARLGSRLTLQPRVRAYRARIDKQSTTPVILPAQLAHLSPAVAETLILTELSG